MHCVKFDVVLIVYLTDWMVMLGFVKIALPYFLWCLIAASFIPDILGALRVWSRWVSWTHIISHDVDLKMVDRSSSFTLVKISKVKIPSMFIDTIVNAGPDKDRFRRGFL